MRQSPFRCITVLAAIVAAATAGACEKTPEPGPGVQPQPAAAPAVVEPQQEIDARVGCFSYTETVSLNGKLVRETHPGRPNFESIKDGDEEERGFYLHLDAPICTNEGRSDEPDERATDSVVRVQLILDSAGYALWRPKLGRKVNVLGSLAASFTGHHHAPLLLYVEGKDANR